PGGHSTARHTSIVTVAISFDVPAHHALLIVLDVRWPVQQNTEGSSSPAASIRASSAIGIAPLTVATSVSPTKQHGLLATISPSFAAVFCSLIVSENCTAGSADSHAAMAI